MAVSETSEMENEAPASSEEGSGGRGDRDLPVGNSPAKSRWPLVLSGFAWLLWVVFLVAMMVSRLRTSA